MKILTYVKLLGKWITDQFILPLWWAVRPQKNSDSVEEKDSNAEDNQE